MAGFPNKPVAVIGAGSFGTAISNLIAQNGPVILVTRDEEQASVIEKTRISSGQPLHERISITCHIQDAANTCDVIFPIVPSQDFYECMVSLKPFVTSNHLLIHGTKGLYLNTTLSSDIRRENIFTMSEVIQQVTGIEKVGCLAGPNLAREIAEGKPAATVIASAHEEVLEAGQQILRSPRFQVLWSDDLYGVELCGVIKNIMAIASGALSGFELGENAKALLVNRSMVEMIHIGSHMGAGLKAFLGVAGIGDLMATCNSPKSRNFNVGYRLAMGETPAHIMQHIEETAEGINTTRLMYFMSEHYGWKTPITKLVYKVLFENFPINSVIQTLMKLPVREDIDFI